MCGLDLQNFDFVIHLFFELQLSRHDNGSVIAV